MKSADAGSNVPGGHAVPQRLTHINSHNALASGHRTLEELLTALRKVPLCIAPFMSAACRPLLQPPPLLSACALQLCAPSKFRTVHKRHKSLRRCKCLALFHYHVPIPRDMLWSQGADLLKHGRLGKPKMHFFRLAEADTNLMWRSSNGKQRSITLASVFQVCLSPPEQPFYVQIGGLPCTHALQSWLQAPRRCKAVCFPETSAETSHTGPCLEIFLLSRVLAQVVPGQTSENFRRHPLPNLARASFSLLYTDTDQSVRTLDLTCRSQQEFELWYWGLHVSSSKSPLMSTCAFSVESHCLSA